VNRYLWGCSLSYIQQNPDNFLKFHLVDWIGVDWFVTGGLDRECMLYPVMPGRELGFL
jgi:hypothetical protein